MFIYIYFACLFVCPFVSNKRQNIWIDRAKMMCGTSHDPQGRYKVAQNYKKWCPEDFDFWKKI